VNVLIVLFTASKTPMPEHHVNRRGGDHKDDQQNRGTARGELQHRPRVDPAQLQPGSPGATCGSGLHGVLGAADRTAERTLEPTGAVPVAPAADGSGHNWCRWWSWTAESRTTGCPARRTRSCSRRSWARRCRRSSSLVAGALIARPERRAARPMTNRRPKSRTTSRRRGSCCCRWSRCCHRARRTVSPKAGGTLIVCVAVDGTEARPASLDGALDVLESLDALLGDVPLHWRAGWRAHGCLVLVSSVCVP